MNTVNNGIGNSNGLSTSLGDALAAAGVNQAPAPAKKPARRVPAVRKVDASDAMRAKRVVVDGSIKELNDRLKELRADRALTLPRVSAAELSLVTKVEKSITVTEADAKAVAAIRKDRSFTEEDKDQIAGAKAAHKIALKDPKIRKQAAGIVSKASYFASFRLTHRLDGKVGFAMRGTV